MKVFILEGSSEEVSTVLEKLGYSNSPVAEVRNLFPSESLSNLSEEIRKEDEVKQSPEKIVDRPQRPFKMTKQCREVYDAVLSHKWKNAKELAERLPGLNPNSISARLSDLAKGGLLESKKIREDGFSRGTMHYRKGKVEESSQEETPN